MNKERNFMQPFDRIVVALLLVVLSGCSKSIDVESLNKKYKATIETEDVAYHISESDLGVRNVWLRLSNDEVIKLAGLKKLPDHEPYLKLGINIGSGKGIRYHAPSELNTHHEAPYSAKNEGVQGPFLVVSEWVHHTPYGYDLFPQSEGYKDYRLRCASNFVNYKKGGEGKCSVFYVRDHFLTIDYLIDFDYLDDFEAYARAVDSILARHIKDVREE
jgi:hypothetical protein